MRKLEAPSGPLPRKKQTNKNDKLFAYRTMALTSLSPRRESVFVKFSRKGEAAAGSSTQGGVPFPELPPVQQSGFQWNSCHRKRLRHSRFRSLRLPPGGPVAPLPAGYTPSWCYKWKIITISILSRRSGLRLHFNFSRQVLPLSSFGSLELYLCNRQRLRGKGLLKVAGNHLAFPAVNVNDR